MSDVKKVRVQRGYHPSNELAYVPEVLALRAEEVYRYLFNRGVIYDRGGLGINEIIAFLYARSFPQNEWKERVKEAFDGMEGI